MIPVTRSYLPDIDKFKSYIDEIYASAWLTNNGKLLQNLESQLAEYLNVKNIILVANGSIALQIAYKALELQGEVITTPFSFAATTSTLAWEGLTPVFADIDSRTFNINPANIEPLITDKTSAIVPVHVFGNPCDVEEIYSIAKKHKLKVIYDAAHAFDVSYKSHNILNFGDVSTLSFHATKLFHTIEGGAIVTNDDILAKKIRSFINFGLTNPSTIESVGTNAKMNEIEAAMGLCVLSEIEKIKSSRYRILHRYQSELEGFVELQQWNVNSTNNNSYAPILLKSEKDLLRVQAKLNEYHVIPRRYFYPSLDTLTYLNSATSCPISQDISARILCLPIYPDLTLDQQNTVIKIIKENV